MATLGKSTEKRSTSAQTKKPQKGLSKKFTQNKKGAPIPKRVGGAFAYYGILIAVTILLGISILMVVSAQSGEYVINQVEKQAEELSEQGHVAGLSDIDASLTQVALRHLIPIVLGIVVCAAISRINYQVLIKLALPFSLVSLGFLLLVPLFGETTKGARRWIYIAGQSFQPSELTKPALLLLAVFVLYAVRKRGTDKLADYREWIFPLLIFLTSCFLIFRQPDLGTLLIVLIGVAAVYALMELPLQRLLIGAGFSGAALILALTLIPNRRIRLLEFLGSFGKEAKATDQALQAQLAFGSGGLLGLGPGLSRQKYRHLPEAQNDFILAIIGEELGLLGITLVLGSFIILAWGSFRIAIMAKDTCGRALAGGAAIMLLVQAALNVYSVIGLGPITGKPLPFVTQGGSAMLGAFILLGLILSVSRFGNQKEISLSGISSLRNSSPEYEEDFASERRSSQKTKRSSQNLAEDEYSNKKKSRSSAGVRSRAESRYEEDEDDEVSLDWRGDSGPYIPRTRTRK